ncbi:unnamed protein product [Caenorhabditis angaria]|uniref:Repressor of RNA polymerase III transcription MAF1 n=1 Tax=Caenorhabditis angaria TaxID=860376 RepID=A0A9P1I294_9PELO|nr:unnamed protein product [Caenorhabditis angaria]
MKYLENSGMEALSSSISIGAIDCIMDFKVETYSCKMISSDKKQWKTHDKNVPWGERQPLSPPDDFASLSASPVANTIGHAARLRHLSSCSGSDNDFEEINYVDSVSRKTLYDLIRVLNSSFPDYDFTDVKSESFSLVNFDDVNDFVDAKLSSCIHNYKVRREELWSVVEEAIVPADCRIYSFKSQYNDDPFSEDGCMWSLAFIFYNKNLKRFMILTCRCLSKQTELDSFDHFSDEENEVENQ